MIKKPNGRTGNFPSDLGKIPIKTKTQHCTHSAHNYGFDCDRRSVLYNRDRHIRETLRLLNPSIEAWKRRFINCIPVAVGFYIL